MGDPVGTLDALARSGAFLVLVAAGLIAVTTAIQRIWSPAARLRDRLDDLHQLVVAPKPGQRSLLSRVEALEAAEVVRDKLLLEIHTAVVTREEPTGAIHPPRV